MGLQGLLSWVVPTTPLPGGRGAEIPPRVLHLPHVRDLHRGRGHLHAGGTLQAVLVSAWAPSGPAVPTPFQVFHTGVLSPPAWRRC